LSVEYPALAGAALSWPGPIETITGGTLLLVASWSLAWALWRPRRGALALALFWPAAVFLSVALVIGAHEPGADRHAYPLLASMAVSIAVATSNALDARPLKARGAGVLQPAAAAVALLACAGLFLAMRSQERLPAWRNDVSLWRATLATTPASQRARANLAAALAARGRLHAARRILCREREAPQRASAPACGRFATARSKGRPAPAAASGAAIKGNDRS
ncbi:MAG: hypothetical protein D6760_07270, partial [Deltaproteobacteria bacterium]